MRRKKWRSSCRSIIKRKDLDHHAVLVDAMEAMDDIFDAVFLGFDFDFTGQCPAPTSQLAACHLLFLRP